MTSKKDRLLFTRKRLVSEINHQTTFIATFDKNTNPKTAISRKAALEEAWDDFKSNTEAIETTKDWVGSEEFIQEANEARDKYMTAIDNIMDILPDDTGPLHTSLNLFRQNRNRTIILDEPIIEEGLENEQDNNVPGTTPNAASTPGGELHQNAQQQPRQFAQQAGMPASIKLKPLEIKPFSGILTDWPEFKAACEATFAHLMDDISRFRYVKLHLTGEPAQLVKHLPLVGNSHHTAWQMLKKRYDNERAIINANLKRLFELPKLRNETLEDLKEMFNTTNDCVAALNSFDIDTSSWNSILIFLLSQRLDSVNVRYWEEKIQGSKKIPPLSQFTDFLDIRINVLESTAFHVDWRASSETQRKQKIFFTADAGKKCTICAANEHFAFRCPLLTGIPADQRIKFVTEKGLCINCFHSHKVHECTSRFSCRFCNERHNSVLHPPVRVHNVTTNYEIVESEPEIEAEELQAREMQTAFVAHVNENNSTTQVMLATAIVRIQQGNRQIFARALIDQGATANLISKRLCQALALPERNVGLPILGVCDTVTCEVKKQVRITVKPRQNLPYELQTPALVVPRITSVDFSRPIDELPYLNGLELADPEFNKSGRIDLLLGSAVHGEIILDGLIKGIPGQPIAQKTELGWIVSGGNGGQKVSIFTLRVSNESLSQSLQRFWEAEEIPKNIKYFTPDEKLAEKTFVETTKRCADGRFMVTLPFKQDPPVLGESYQIARKRYESMMRRFHLKPELKVKYDASIQEYLDLGHMELTDESVKIAHNYLPHHPVIKESSTTTKIRAVYDASCKTTNGNSLNSQLLIGPTIQSDLFSLFLQWRRYEYAISGDIEKMYRQIWMNPIHSEYQRILWQAPGSSEIKSYRLKTVTFGVASAPFLAIRTLFLIAEDIKDSDPDLSEKIIYQFYVDDFFDSVSSIEEAKRTIKRMSETMAKYGFLLRKWKANNKAILSDLEDSEKDSAPSNVFKTLGVQWQPESDEFLFIPADLKNNKEWTKRKILSEIAKLFDPLGFLSPCIVTAKIFMQQLWLLQVGWDDKLAEETTNKWLSIYHQFVNSCAVKIPRWIGLKNDVKHVSLQGFCDASERAIACVVFIRVEAINGAISTHLVAAKTKVAPLRKITVPRLELNAAVLLSELMERVDSALKIPNSQKLSWSDSMIVLYWLANHPSRWKTYVAHRVASIQKVLGSQQWRHIESALNPADCASRGLSRDELEKFDMWWHGPNFLTKQQSEWPETAVEAPKQILEEKSRNFIGHVACVEPNPIILRFSDYNRMIRVMSICLRWILPHIQWISKNRTHTEVAQTCYTERVIIKLVQSEAFPHEIKVLQKGKSLPASNSLCNLDPYLDSDGLLRVGGRIHLADLSESEKHPIILPASHHFTKLFIKHLHLGTLHGGIALTFQALRQRGFWVINAKTTVTSVVYKCITCFRFKRQLLIQKMGILPSYRVQQAAPFAFCGVDYAGYFKIKTSRLRNAQLSKAYIALFVCLTTRAVHLELVSDLSAIQFLKAFKRFISRRGIPSHMFSDNAGNFTNAAKEIQKSLEQALQDSNSGLRHTLLKNRIEWSYIPARAPHFGGWESSVKLVKHHLKRVLGEVRLTFEDFNTLIIEIEAVVNSRPLWSLPTKPDEYDPLTPGHFLVFRPLNALPEGSVDHLPINRLDQYQYLQRLLSDFWKLWSREYIHSLQVRKKWLESKPNIRKNQIVLIAEDNQLPTQWLMGKVVEVFYGPDGLVRVADVKIADPAAAKDEFKCKIYRRAVHRLSILPIIDNQIADEDQSVEHNCSTGGSMLQHE